MTHAEFVFYFPFAISAVTIWTSWSIGSRWRWCFHVGFLSQIMWLTWIVVSGMWGHLPGCLFLGSIHVRNWWKWRQEGVFLQQGRPVHDDRIRPRRHARRLTHPGQPEHGVRPNGRGH